MQINIGGAYELDTELDGLRSKVSMLRGLATAVGEEARATAAQTNALEETMQQAKAAMKAASKRMDKLYREGGGGNILLVVVMFALFVFLAVYVWTRISGLVRNFV